MLHKGDDGFYIEFCDDVGDPVAELGIAFPTRRDAKNYVEQNLPVGTMIRHTSPHDPDEL